VSFFTKKKQELFSLFPNQFREYLEANGYDTSQMGLGEDSVEEAYEEKKQVA
jgi:hypothetical protein